jgi:hypothetical protein
MRAGLALVVIVLNTVAIVSVLGAPTTAGRKLAWVTAVVLAPILGALAWLLTGRARQGAGTALPKW